MFDGFFEKLEKSKEDFRYIYFDPFKNELYLVKEWFDCEEGKGLIETYVNYATAKMFGCHAKITRCTNWQYIGVL